MSPFIPLLREAHAVTIAHQRGDATIAAICARTRLPVPTVNEWAGLLRLPIRPPNYPSSARHVGLVLDNITLP